MSNTNNDTSEVAALEDQRPLADSELDGVSGGNLAKACCTGAHYPTVVIETR